MRGGGMGMKYPGDRSDMSYGEAGTVDSNLTSEASDHDERMRGGSKYNRQSSNSRGSSKEKNKYENIRLTEEEYEMI